jgi:peptide deformylase
MNAKDLKKGKEYTYTASANTVTVMYKHETLNGFLFTDGLREEELTALAVKNYIEEIK